MRLMIECASGGVSRGYTHDDANLTAPRISRGYPDLLFAGKSRLQFEVGGR